MLKPGIGLLIFPRIRETWHLMIHCPEPVALVHKKARRLTFIEATSRIIYIDLVEMFQSVPSFTPNWLGFPRQSVIAFRPSHICYNSTGASSRAGSNQNGSELWRLGPISDIIWAAKNNPNRYRRPSSQKKDAASPILVVLFSFFFLVSSLLLLLLIVELVDYARGSSHEYSNEAPGRGSSASVFFFLRMVVKWKMKTFRI